MAIEDEDRTSVESDAGDESPGALHRFRAFVRRHRILNTTWQIGVFTIGVTVLVGGLIMMIAPGPGILGIIVGLAILATEFTWAQRALRHARQAADKAKEKALDPRTKRRNTILAVVFGVLGGVAITFYLIEYGFNLPWNIEDYTPWT